MEKEQIIELNEIRKYLEISKEDFIKIIALAKIRQKKSKIIIKDEMIYEIIYETLLNYDHDISENRQDFYYDSLKENKKTPEESFMIAIKNLFS